MSNRSLEDLIVEASGAHNLLRAHKYDRVDLPSDIFPSRIIPQVPHEYSRWEREAKGWRESVALFDLSHHMDRTIVEGPDAQKLLGYLSCNALFKSKPVSASQIICTNNQGALIGDGIVLHEADDRFAIMGAPMVPTWIRYQAEISGLDVVAHKVERSPVFSDGVGNTRDRFVFQIQGPLAGQLIEKLNSGPLEQVRFFGITEITIAGLRLQALRHGMAGAMGLEVWGPWEERKRVRSAIVEAGQEFDIRMVGAAAYLIPAIESGWYQGSLPAIYGDDMVDFRRWLPHDDHYAVLQLTGSKTYDDVSGYYRTPYDLGYGNFLNLDHDCIGRDALAAMDPAGSYRKVTLAWQADDATGLFREMLSPDGKDVRFLHLPVCSDDFGVNFDVLTDSNGTEIGTSAYVAFSPAERTVLSLALVRQDVEFGQEAVVHWGQAGGGYGNYVMPATDIVPIRATVSPAPYSRVARESYRASAA